MLEKSAFLLLKGCMYKKAIFNEATFGVLFKIFETNPIFLRDSKCLFCMGQIFEGMTRSELMLL